MSMPKRTIYYVRYVAARSGWAIFKDSVQVQESIQVSGTHWDHKAEAVEVARRVARGDAPSELIVMNKNGRIGKGGSSRSTYGSGPSGSKG